MKNEEQEHPDRFCLEYEKEDLESSSIKTKYKEMLSSFCLARKSFFDL